MHTLVRDAVPTSQNPEPSSLLTLVAGEFASHIARAWPAPHAEFLAAPAARRHLACMALALGQDLAPLSGLLIAGRLRRAIAAAAPEGPPGLERALSRLGEVAWAPADYRSLLTLLAQPQAAKLLRHAASIAPDLVRRLAALPPALSHAVTLALTLDEPALAAVVEAHAAIAFRIGPNAARACADRWAQAASVQALVAAVRRDLYPEPARPPFPATARLKPLATKAALFEVAGRYRNCLASEIPDAASGWSAYYEWLGPPGAVVEIQRDSVFGWRLEQVRLADNAGMAESDRDGLLDELALLGVHVGRSGWELGGALANADARYVRRAQDRRRLRPMGRVLGEVFGEED